MSTDAEQGDGAIPANADALPILAFDIGDGHIRAGVIEADGTCSHDIRRPTPPNGAPDQLFDALRTLRDEIITQHKIDEAGVGVAVPGIWDRMTGVMRRAVNLPALEGVNIRDLFTQALERTVVIETDVNAATWAQWRATTPTVERFVYLSLGTGVGGGVVLDGELVRHTNGGPGHLGFLIVEPDAQESPGNDQGVPGSISAIAAGAVLSSEGKYASDEATLRRAARGLAIAIANIVHLYQPHIVALGGGVIEHNPTLVAFTQQAFAARRSVLTPRQFAIAKAPLTSDSAGICGAALLARAAANSQKDY